MQRHQGGVDGDGDDREVEIVKHDVDVLVDPSLEAQVQVQRPAADVLQGAGVIRPARAKQKKGRRGKNAKDKLTNASSDKTLPTPTCNRHL